MSRPGGRGRPALAVLNLGSLWESPVERCSGSQPCRLQAQQAMLTEHLLYAVYLRQAALSHSS